LAKIRETNLAINGRKTADYKIKDATHLTDDLLNSVIAGGSKVEAEAR
jgi:hypothetical protein